MMLRKTKQKIKKKATSHPVLEHVFKSLAVMIGAVMMAAGLELFLVPNGFLDGGITGVSIILTTFFPIPLGVFIGLLNIPFLFVAYRHAGWTTAIRTALGVATLSVSTIILHHYEPVTDEFVLALGYGGVLVGIGVGLALRYSGALDGTEILAVAISNKVNLGVDQLILAINFFVFLVAGFVFTPEQALASFLLFYVVVTPTIKKVMDGDNGTKHVSITSVKHKEITEAINQKFNKKVILIDAHKGDMVMENGEQLKLVITYISRVEESALMDIIDGIDPRALVALTEVSSISGGVFAKNKHH